MILVSKWEFYGDLSKVIEYTIDKAVKRIEEKYESLEKDLKKIFTERIKRISSDIRRDFEERLRSIEYDIESKRSKLEIELKNNIGESRSKAIESLYRRAREDIINLFNQDKNLYKKFLRIYLVSVLREFREKESIIIETDPVGVELISEILGEENLIKRYNIDVKASNDIRKGFRTYSAGREIVYRYDIDTLIDSVEQELKIVISKTLFGAE